MPTLVKRKMSGWKRKIGFRVQFSSCFSEEIYSPCKKQLSTLPTQLFWNHIRNETAETAEYAWNMLDEIVTTAGISSYSGLERWDSSPGPSIFRGIFRNTKFWRTLYIPKDIPEYLVDAKVGGGGGVVKILSIFVLLILIPVLYSYWYYTEYDTLDKILSQYDTVLLRLV